ncbi:Aps1 protein [Starmerella bacillaris]|uniref:AP complex subunit sigma n=1 Tax=Starmerella bacillaris TaxID=1247836 RepID=A0AAV5RPJ8_STABA|nr:Aps1 protein [Starmerella bacillaris]
MAFQYILLLSRQGKTRLSKWFETYSMKDKGKITRDVTTLVLSRKNKMSNFLEYKDSKVVYRRYASLYFVAGIEAEDNELLALEVIHRYVEQMDKYFGNVCELDIIFNFQRAYYILDEIIVAGEIIESSRREPIKRTTQQDALEVAEAEASAANKLLL